MSEPKHGISVAAPRLVQQRMERFIRGGGDPKDPHSPLWRWNSARNLEQLREEFEAGSKMALWEALDEIAFQNFRSPKWVRDALMRGCGALVDLRAGSLDEAFGAPHEKSANLPAKRRRKRLLFPVRNAVVELLNKGYPRSDETFGMVAEQFDLSVSTVRSYFYTSEKIVRSLLDQGDLGS